jgi:hypothetical protein
VLGTPPDKIEREVVRFVNVNRDALLRHWYGETDAKEMLDDLQRVS